MRRVDPAAQAIREKRGAIKEVPMVWIGATDRDTGEPRGIGLWRGEDTEVITVTDMWTHVASPRTFYNAGLSTIGSVSHEQGLNIRPVSIKLSAISDAALAAIRQYEARGVPVQGFKRCYDPDTYQPVAVEPWFKGYLNKAPSVRPAPGGEPTLTLEVVSTALLLTISSAATKSDVAQRRRNGDRIRRYKNVAGTWDVPWGSREIRHTES